MAATNLHARRDQSQPVPRIGRDELNLAEFPIALLADRVSRGQKTLYFEDQHGRLTVTGSDAYGLPTAADADVIIALIHLTKLRNNFSDVKVNFSRYELVNLLGWPDQGWSYKRLEESLDRWHGISLSYDGCWWNNRLKCYTDMKMHIIDTIELVAANVREKTRLAGRGELPLSWFRWNKEFIESCQADNLRQLDLDEYFSLKSAISKRLYRFLGKRFYLRGDWTFDLHEIAFERVGLSRSYRDAYKIREKLQPAIDELERIGFLKPLGRDARYTRIDRGRWSIRLARQSAALATPQQAAPTAVEPEPPLVAELASRGVTRATAADLVRRYPADAIEAKLAVFDWLVEKQDKRVARSPAGYLVKSIADDYAAPKGFESKAARQARAEAKRQAEREVAEGRRREREQEARDRAILEEVDAYIKRLSPAERKALEAEALAAADSEAREGYEEAPARYRAVLLQGLVREYVARELGRKTIPVRA